MTDDRFDHMLKLSVIYLPVLQGRSIFKGKKPPQEKANVLNALQIIAETFVEMQRRLGVKPSFRIEKEKP